MKNRSSGNKFAFHRDSKLSEYRVSIGFVWKHTLCYGHGRYYSILEETLRSFGKRNLCHNCVNSFARNR